MAVESFSFLFVSCDLVTFFGNARIAVTAGLFVVDHDISTDIFLRGVSGAL